ncbi:MAG: general secretion pathway protein GspK [Myxococcales bacterium]|nr:general secretion pathway protein GspK [Myxococcales bacterium]
MMAIFSGIKKLLAKAHQRKLSRREDGIAIISVVILLAVLGANTADFAYNARIDYTSAINARNDLQAHYLARSAINLSKLLLKVQSKFIDPNRKYLGGMDLQIADYAPMMMTAFNSKEGAEMLGSILGLESKGIKGLGVEVGSFDLKMESLDGKINLNCGGGANTGSPVVTRFAAQLAALMLPQRYNRIFEQPDENGQYATRLEVMRAIIDWADQDTVMFGSTAAEDYRYNARKDKYENKNQYFDTVGELRMVKGVGEDFLSAFGKSFTVYGDCKVNVNLADVRIITALIIQYAATPNDPALQFRNLALLSRYVIAIRSMMGGFNDFKTLVQAIENPTAQLGVASAVDAVTSGGSSQQPTGLPPVTGVKMNQKKLQEAVVIGGPRRIWKITAEATVGRIKKRIIAVWDTKFISSQARRHNFGPGAFLFWREE